MNFTDYLTLIARQLQDAENRRDTEEWIRLANVLIDATKEAIRKLGPAGQ